MTDRDDYGRAGRPAAPDLSAAQVDGASLPMGVMDKKTGANIMTTERVKEAGVIAAFGGYMVMAGAVATVLNPGGLGMIAVGAGAALSSVVVPLLAVGAAIGTIGVGVALAAKGIEMLRNKIHGNEPAAPSHAPAHKAGA